MPKWKPGTQKGRSRAGKIYSSRDVPSDGKHTQVKYAPIESKIDEMVVVGYAPEEATYPEEVTDFRSRSKKCRNIPAACPQ